MHIAMSKEMHNIDLRCAEEYGISELVLMENAGCATAEVAASLLQQSGSKKVLVVASTGNNGGDGFVAARHLANAGYSVTVFVSGDKAHLKNSAQINYDILHAMKLRVFDIKSEGDWNRFKVYLRFTDLVVDALMGTGFMAPLRDDLQQIIKAINQSGKKTLSIDVPSGVEADTGRTELGIKADTTVTFSLPKPGLYLYPGCEHAGRVVVKNIGIPRALLANERLKCELIDEALVQNNLLPRPITTYKGSCGRILAIAGSTGYLGAAELCSKAALRAGAGIVTLAVPEDIYALLAPKLTEIMVRPLPLEDDGTLGTKAIEYLLPREESYDVILIGPGLGRGEAVMNFVRDLAQKTKKPLLIDADAIYAFAKHGAELKKLAQVPILTPHLGELSALLGTKVKDLKADLWNLVRQAAQEFNAIIVAKSERTIVAYPDGKLHLTSVGNAGMATAGSGDVLAGTICGVRMECSKPEIAASVGVYLHGKAGDIAAQKGMAGLIAGDLVESLPAARQFIEGH